MAEAAVELYEAIGAASARMLAAACADDWDGLVAAEADCAALIARARSRADPVPLDERARLRKADILRRALADDAEIRARLEPWLAKLEALLGAARSERRVRRSYGG